VQPAERHRGHVSFRKSVTYLPACRRKRAGNSQLTEITGLLARSLQLVVRLQQDLGSRATLTGLSRSWPPSPARRLRPARNANRFSCAQCVLPALCEAARSVHARLSRRTLRWHSNAHFRPPRQSVVLSGIAKGRTHPPRTSGFSLLCARLQQPEKCRSLD
jgi:hypothetical protein